ncbi:MAG: type III-B CRISPR module RAMP protein Cmr6 [Sulfurovum sp.]|nr:type III-B CRISPR module RAMP protein Cmr6 [Sulfurovum sp.]
MSSANVGWMFYKEVFEKLEDNAYPRDMKRVNKDILDSTLVQYDYPKGSHHAIKLTTTYPGLVVGSGYTHALKDEKENFNFGFFFDHTTGMPIIPGSTVKGVLRSMFGQNKNEKYKEEKEKLIDALLPQNARGKVKSIKEAIFEGVNSDDTQQSTYERDIFLDAFVISREKKLLADDTITPHKNPFKDPVPNRMLKIASDIEICFAFELHDFYDGDSMVLSAEEKEKLFLDLLLWNGIGAKTNVGYGQLNLFLTEEQKAEVEREEEKRKAEEKANADRERSEDKETKRRELEAKQKADREAKKSKANEGINTLLKCNTLAEGFKLLKDSFGKNPNPTKEQKEIILAFKKQHKKLSKGNQKTFKKYGVS